MGTGFWESNLVDGRALRSNYICVRESPSYLGSHLGKPVIYLLRFCKMHEQPSYTFIFSLAVFSGLFTIIDK